MNEKHLVGNTLTHQLKYFVRIHLLLSKHTFYSKEYLYKIHKTKF